MKLYMLNTYGEYGPTDIKITNDWPNVWRLIDSYGTEKRSRDYEKGKLAGIMEDWDRGQCESPTGSWELSEGWGGVQFHIVELDEND
jgi:hypothetical protein